MTTKETVRLVADEGKVLTNGTTSGRVVDCLAEKASEWYEIDAPTEESADSAEVVDEETTETEATETTE